MFTIKTFFQKLRSFDENYSKLESTIENDINWYLKLVETHKKKSSKNIPPIERGIAHSKSTVLEDILEHPRNSILDVLALFGGQNEQVETYQKVLDKFEQNPSDINALIAALNQYVPKEIFAELGISQDAINGMYESKNFINSDRRISLNTIYKSFSILIASRYLQNSPDFDTLQIKNCITDEELADAISTLMWDVFGVEKKINHKNFSRKIRVKTLYENMEMYDYDTACEEPISPVHDLNKRLELFELINSNDELKILFEKHGKEALEKIFSELAIEQIMSDGIDEDNIDMEAIMQEVVRRLSLL